ncbi:MAG: AAA family ATPase [Verrucomicrobia bacterium]|nr:AAA family ATPase [Verrucomicrobiota bacterium]MDA1087929.1 AAA family ATPase [Verrucomicrobiota bacterium]
MSYYKALGLDKEPFSTSPDPAFFYLSKQHKAALCKLQVSVKLKRGLSVVVGDVGTGKTSLSRKFAQLLNGEDDVVFRMILNPFFGSEKQFLSRLTRLYRVPIAREDPTELEYIEAFERYLFEQGVEQGKTIILLIDEAQMLPEYVLEVLRILLNYETNEYKILQLILVGQIELLPVLRNRSNFWDRISTKLLIEPLAEDEISQIIDFRLREAGYSSATPLFTREAVSLAAAHTRGYPRKLASLCHDALEYLVMHDEVVVLRETVQSLIDQELSSLFMDDLHEEAVSNVVA